LDWHTLRAGRFDVHYPTELATWAEFVAQRLPAVDSAVTALVGYSPSARVQIIADDPFDVANGFAFTLLDKPVIVFWASPPNPREGIGQFRTWGEMLATHEFGHVAHLTRPSRNPMTRLLWRLAPVDLGPIALRAPRWVIEGYATYIEGKVTGSGRPHGLWRPTTLRQWAIEGRLPTYDQLSSWGDFEGGDFAYLAGSAFLEWLGERQGDSSLVLVWRRLTARTTRSFDDAFAGVFGDSPRALYGRFTAQITADAVDIETTMARREVAGEMVQRLTRGTGDPALSPDGRHAALVLRRQDRPARVVVWSTSPESDSVERRARARLLARDPEDVPARRIYPLPKRALATLVARDGRSYEDPRWFPDGKRLLLWRPTRRPDGSLRPELYEWTFERGRVRRLTSGASLRDADPSPDGRMAAALRCAGGFCDVVLVDLATQRVRVLGRGDVYTTYARPRWGPDGRTVAVALQRANRWRIALLDTAGAPVRYADPDDGANRFDPAWLYATSLVVTSDRNGTANLERLDLGPGRAAARALTRVTGAAIAPEPDRADGSIWFLSLHSRGYDVRRLPSPAPVVDGDSPLLDAKLAPVVLEPSQTVHAFAASPTSPAGDYGVSPRSMRWLPIGSIGAGGRAAGVALVNDDPVGRLTILAQAAAGNGDAWRGAALDAAWRGARPLLRASIFGAATSPRPVDPGSAPSSETDGLAGGRLRADLTRYEDAGELRIGLGAAIGEIQTRLPPVTRSDSRDLAFGEIAMGTRQRGDHVEASESLAANVAAGQTSGGPFYQRLLTTLALHGGMMGQSFVDLTASYGRVSEDAVPFEQFSIGGPPAYLVDQSILTQQVTMGALPSRSAIGDRMLVYRASTSWGGLSPFYWGASTRTGGGRFMQWHRVAGVELILDEGPLPVLGLPGGRLTAGVGRSLDAPFAGRTRGYVTVSLRP
jgi:hypothetical protein